MRSVRSRLLLLVGACLVSLVLWALLFLAAVAIVGVAPDLEDAAAMDAWMTRMSSWFLAWRVLLYAGTVAGWIWMRRRIRQRDRIGRQICGCCA